MRKACFFDRDGVLIEEENYLSDPDKVKLCSGVPEAIKLLRNNDYMIIVVSNQSGIARGFFSENDLQKVEQRLDELLQEQNVSVDRYYYCFHHPKGTVKKYAVECNCRKPEPGMLLHAAKEYDLDLKQCFMIGDKISDVEAGVRAGCRSAALVRTGHGAEQETPSMHHVFDTPDILSAVKKLLDYKQKITKE